MFNLDNLWNSTYNNNVCWLVTSFLSCLYWCVNSWILLIKTWDNPISTYKCTQFNQKLAFALLLTVAAVMARWKTIKSAKSSTTWTTRNYNTHVNKTAHGKRRPQEDRPPNAAGDYNFSFQEGGRQRQARQESGVSISISLVISFYSQKITTCP